MKTKQSKGNAPKAPAGAKRGGSAVGSGSRRIPSTPTKGFPSTAARKFAKLSGV